MNMYDLEEADVVIFDAWGIGEPSGGGMHFEAGYAAHKGIPVIVVGNPRGSYYTLDDKFTIVSSYETARSRALQICLAKRR